MKYKGFIVHLNKYYIEIDVVNEYEFRGHLLIANGKAHVMKEYLGNKTVYDAIDVCADYRTKELLTPPHSLVLNFWFEVLKRNLIDFKNTFGFGNINHEFVNVESCIEFWKEFRSKDEEMGRFITDEKINEFWDIQKENRLIALSKAGKIELLV